jgi:hypothetical protein
MMDEVGDDDSTEVNSSESKFTLKVLVEGKKVTEQQIFNPQEQ